MLENEFQLLAKSLPYSQANGSSHWETTRLKILNQLQMDGPANFLTWQDILYTMVIDSEEVAQKEYNALSHSPNYLNYNGIGNGKYSKTYPHTMNNMIHQAYHIDVFFQLTGKHLEDYDNIIEFGGGYGCMCDLIHRQGFKGNYYIFDFPEFHIIQDYYLKNNNVNNFNKINNLNLIVKGTTAFVGMWSFSESPIAFRDSLKPYIKQFNADVFFALQSSYEGYDNISYFQELRDYLGKRQNQLEEIPWLGNNYYMTGTNG